MLRVSSFRNYGKNLFFSLVLIFCAQACRSRVFSQSSITKNELSENTSRCEGNKPLSSLEPHLNPLMKLNEVENSNSQIPKILRFKRPPPYEILLNKNENPFFEKAKEHSKEEFPSAWSDFDDKSLLTFLDGLQFGAINAHYYFMGGGGYLGALIAKAIFAQTSAEKRFLPMLLSRGAIKTTEAKSRHFSFFDRLCLHKASSPYFVMLDSFVPENDEPSAANRSNVQITMQLRDYLKNALKISDSKANLRVLPAGPTESYGTVYAAKETLDSYFKAVSEINTTLSEEKQVYLRYPQDFWEQFLKKIYQNRYWKGHAEPWTIREKYKTFDELDMPTNFDSFDNIKPATETLVLTVREQHIKYYLAVYFRAKEFAEKNQEKIREIARKMDETNPKF